MIASRPPDLEATTAEVSSYAADRLVRQEALRATLTTLLATGTSGQSWVLELGCGHGHFLTAYARQHPEAHCLGVDFCRDRIRRAERKRRFAGLTNLHFMHGEAGEFLAAVPDGFRFCRVFVLFPDPWPKRRHRKNRLLSAVFLTRIAPLCQSGCELFFRSDAMDYVDETRVLFGRHDRWRLRPGTDLPFECETVFQQKAQRFASACAVLVN